MKKHGAIETKYQGFRFRSRLEARWAVFFDTLGIEWKYESEGFTKDGVCYLPDFFLPQTKTWVEVKGSTEGMDADRKKLRKMLEEDSPIPFIDDSYAARSNRDFCPGLLILGEIPDPNGGLTLHQIMQTGGGETWIQWLTFYDPSYGEYRPCIFSDVALSALEPYFKDFDSSEEFSIKPIILKTEFVEPGISDAYAAARGARFEHGEKGRR